MTPDLLLSFDFPPMGGGIARWMGELALRYPAGELIVSTGSVPGGVESDAAFPNRINRLAVPARRLKTLPGLLRWSRRASALVQQYGAGFIWCGNLRPAAYPARWVHRRRGIPYGVILHGSDLLLLRRNYLASRFKRAVARSLLGSAEVLIANSQWTRDRAGEVLSELGLAGRASRVRVVPLGTDPSRFRPGLDPEPFRRAEGLPSGRWLVTVARLVPHKGIDITIRALARLAGRFPDLHYAVVGRGKEQPVLEALAASLGLAERVRFLTDVADDRLPEAYALAELYVGISRQTATDAEGFGIALLEAQAAGKPVVAGRSGGVSDAVRDGETGLLVDPEDVPGVAEAITALLSDPGAAARLGARGRAEVTRYFNWDRVVEELRQIAGAARSAPR